MFRLPADREWTLHALLQMRKWRTFSSWMQEQRNEVVERGSFKQGRVTTTGRVLTVISRESRKCENCDSPEKLKQCSSCKEMLYCSKTCQQQNWNEHKQKCTHLSSVTEEKNVNIPPPPTRVGHPHKVTSLVGRQCLVECYLNGHQLQALWDTLRCQ